MGRGGSSVPTLPYTVSQSVASPCSSAWGDEGAARQTCPPFPENRGRHCECANCVGTSSYLVDNCATRRKTLRLFCTLTVHTLLYTIILICISVWLSMLSNCRSQFLLDCLGRCLKLFVLTDSTSCHELASQFALAFSLYAKKTINYREDRPSRMWLLNEPATLIFYI